MKFWLDAQLSPSLAVWLSTEFKVEAIPIRDIGLRDAADREIFFRARSENAVVMTKDSDFLRLLDEHGSPPQIMWITVGNTSNEHLKQILKTAFSSAMEILKGEDPVVEISEQTG